MKRYIFISLILVFCVLPLSAEDEKLGDYVEGLLDSHELAVGLHKEGGLHLHITTYLARLKLKDESKPVPPELRYDLWRHYLDCHHLCQVFYHQTYMLPDDLQIFSMLEAAFPGFKTAARAEGGQIWISGGFDFLQTVDPHEAARKQATKAEQEAAGQSATAQ